MTHEETNRALFRACESGDVEAARFHLEKGVDVRAKGRWGETPLHVACTEDRPDLVRLLLEKGADVNVKTDAGSTPLHVACWYGHPDLVLFLIEHGADVNAKDMNGRTPLNLTLMLPERGAVIAVRERILGLFREHAPEAVMEAYCTAQERR